MMVAQKENICENAVEGVGKMAHGILFQGASHFTINFCNFQN